MLLFFNKLITYYIWNDYILQILAKLNWAATLWTRIYVIMFQMSFFSDILANHRRLPQDPQSTTLTVNFIVLSSLYSNILFVWTEIIKIDLFTFFLNAGGDGYYGLCNGQLLRDINDKCVLSKNVNLPSEIQFQFWYFMDGFQIGTLELIGDQETVIWSLTGRQNREWLLAKVTLMPGMYEVFYYGY